MKKQTTGREPEAMMTDKIGYVVKVYPRFSETFVVTEILGREAQGEDISIYAMRPTTDTRFHPELARVKAPVRWINRPTSPRYFWEQIASSLTDAGMAERFGRIMPQLATLEASDVAQGVALAKQVREDGITHLHAHFASLAGRMAWVASQLTGIPYTVTTHAKDIFHQDVDFVWLRRICADAANVIAISKYNEDYLQRVLAGTGANIVLRYNALELSRFPFSAGAPVGPTLKVAAVGRLVAKKGFTHLIEAVSMLRGRGIRVHLTLAGEGELRPQLEAQVADLGLEESVTMVGALTQAEVSALVRGADVFVAPCVPGGDGNMDGLPTVVLEAMALGTPVVATSVTGLPEVIINNHTGVLIELGDLGERLSRDVADALEGVADGSVPGATLARGARALIEELFDNRRQAAALRELETDMVTTRPQEVRF